LAKCVVLFEQCFFVLVSEAKVDSQGGFFFCANAHRLLGLIVSMLLFLSVLRVQKRFFETVIYALRFLYEVAFCLCRHTLSKIYELVGIKCLKT
jgi:hypothetical protein